MGSSFTSTLLKPAPLTGCALDLAAVLSPSRLAAPRSRRAFSAPSLRGPLCTMGCLRIERRLRCHRIVFPFSLATQGLEPKWLWPPQHLCTAHSNYTLPKRGGEAFHAAPRWRSWSLPLPGASAARSVHVGVATVSASSPLFFTFDGRWSHTPGGVSAHSSPMS